MILTLTPNPALDVTYRVPWVVLGESHRVEGVVERAGGKGVNVASVLTAMSCECVAVAPVGGESAFGFGADLAGRGITHVLVDSHRQLRRSVAVVDESGVATLFNEPGVELPAQAWENVIAAVRRAASSARVLTVCGSLPPHAPTDLVRRLTEVAHEAGLRVVLDVSGAHLTRALGAAPELVKPNRGEATDTLGGVGFDPPAAAELALALTIAGAQAAIVSDGVAGLTLVSGPVRMRAWLPKALRGNPTGAGDALAAALAADLDSREAGLPTDAGEWVPVLRRAVAWAGAAVLQPVAGAIDAADVARLEPEVEVEELPS